ncbi:MAG: hypothetical protein NC909_00515 [Candidatus Omnitrophica bacterium]|nr:hypothetical protein [Candidatus Omnitrophota bacterium]
MIKRPVLALGAHTKNTLCFAEGKSFFISRIHPDLDNWQDFLEFKKDLNFFLKKRPALVVCDLHPLYRSTQVAENLSQKYILKKVQHHHAHIASCMLENNLKNEKVIGIAFDGTGLGKDNTLWGAEFFLCDYHNFKRVAHLKNVVLAGQERAIREPWRITFAWLYSLYKERVFKLNIEFIHRIDYKKAQILKKIITIEFNSILSSSMGRLFDAVAVLILNRFNSKFEGELPKRLEDLAKKFRGNFRLNLKDYVFKIEKEDKVYIIDPLPLFRGIIKEIIHKKDKREIAFKFHKAVSLMVKKICVKLRNDTGINKVVLSGGVFQNSLLQGLVLDLLYKNRFTVFHHKKISCSDAGLALGQAAIANFL